jgi:hypothetical protein
VHPHEEHSLFTSAMTGEGLHMCLRERNLRVSPRGMSHGRVYYMCYRDHDPVNRLLRLCMCGGDSTGRPGVWGADYVECGVGVCGCAVAKYCPPRPSVRLLARASSRSSCGRASVRVRVVLRSRGVKPRQSLSRHLAATRVGALRVSQRLRESFRAVICILRKRSVTRGQVAYTQYILLSSDLFELPRVKPQPLGRFVASAP